MLEELLHARIPASSETIMSDVNDRRRQKAAGDGISGGFAPSLKLQGTFTLPFSILIKYTVGMLWPLSLPQAPAW